MEQVARRLTRCPTVAPSLIVPKQEDRSDPGAPGACCDRSGFDIQNPGPQNLFNRHRDLLPLTDRQGSRIHDVRPQDPTAGRVQRLQADGQVQVASIRELDPERPETGTDREIGPKFRKREFLLGRNKLRLIPRNARISATLLILSRSQRGLEEYGNGFRRYRPSCWRL